MGKLIDLTGQKFGRLTVLGRAPKPEGATSTSAFWYCICECGTKKVISGNVLRQGKAKSCGCLNKEIKDKDSLLGKVFGRLTVIDRISKPQGIKGGDAYWVCKCECGNFVSVMGKSLKNGKTKSCGCYRHDKLVKDLKGQRFGNLLVIAPAGISKDGHQLWRCQCKCGNSHITTGHNLQDGSCQSCGCLTSVGEMEIEQILQENNINYSKQYSFPDLRGERGGLLRFDFAIFENNQLKLLVEFQGEQHYDYSSSFYDKPQDSDIKKQEYCKKHNIPLILIPYWRRGKITLDDLLEGAYGGDEE